MTAAGYVGAIRPPLPPPQALLEHAAACTPCSLTIGAWAQATEPWITLPLCETGEQAALDAMVSEPGAGPDAALVAHAQSCHTCARELAVWRQYPSITIDVQVLCDEQRAMHFA